MKTFESLIGTINYHLFRDGEPWWTDRTDHHMVALLDEIHWDTNCPKQGICGSQWSRIGEIMGYTQLQSSESSDVKELFNDDIYDYIIFTLQ